MNFKRAIFGLLLVCAATCCLFAQGRRVTIEDVITLADKNVPPPTGSIAGTVVSDATALPVVGAAVTLTRHFDQQMIAFLPDNTSGSRFPTILTDAQGRFLFKEVPDGDYGFTVRKEGYLVRKLGESREEAPTRLTVAQGQRFEGFQIAITPSARIRGYIRDEAGQPLANFPIQIFLPNNIEASVADTVSATDGSFELVGFAAGTVVLVAESPMTGEPQRSFATVVVATINGVSLELSLTRERYNVRGKVVLKESGEPPASAQVSVNSSRRVGERASNRIQATFEYEPKSGSFDISSVASGFYRLDASLPDTPFGCGSINVVVSSSNASDVPLAVTQCK